ncbi:hypothetical protein AVEN_158933-1 [Araneus ventricosus]|uniref:Uncharacterized protein n=1 Tax=Araneus ventricosus TaxID=182803 RepID=A0A4Y2B9T8_ARAVE|nr:hypothetical protein AVEN_158933-1 [Araneus ventricosus]
MVKRLFSRIFASTDHIVRYHRWATGAGIIMDVVADSFEVSDPLTHFAFTHGRQLLRKFHKSAAECLQQTGFLPTKNVSLTVGARGGRFDNLEHFKNTEQTVQVTYTAATEHTCSQGMPGYDASTRCGARATY